MKFEKLSEYKLKITMSNKELENISKKIYNTNVKK